MEATLETIGKALAVPVANEPSGMELVAVVIVVAFAAVMKIFAIFEAKKGKKE
jgi:hypothetical protein